MPSSDTWFKEKHGLSRTIEYRTWARIFERCNNKRNKLYPRYGGRGIKICKRWNDFRTFIEDMGNKPGPEYSIDRINNNGDYKPSNCRWATKKEQSRNTRTNRKITYKGETRVLTEWAEVLGMTKSMLFRRLKKNKTIKEAFERPRYKHRKKKNG